MIPDDKRRALEAALLDFQLMPGKHSLARREPALLFAAMPLVLQVAGGRSLAADDAPPSALVRQAARFFIRSALLQPGADHYALLGLPRFADAQAIKERYRLLMRLLHPDFAGGEDAKAWPADAAARINRAYEVLASPLQRRAYDDDLEARQAPRAAAPQPAPVAATTRANRAVRAARQPAMADPRGRLKRLAGVFGGAGALVLLGLLLAGGGDKEVLVRRQAAPPAPAPVDIAQAPVAPGPAAIVQPTVQPAMLPRPAPPAPIPVLATPERVTLQAAPRPAMVAPAPAVVQSVPGTPPPAAPVRLAAIAAQPEAPKPLPPATTVGAAAEPRAGVTLMQAHPILSRVLQQLESGQPDGLLTLLERDARNPAATQALARHYAGLIDGAKPVRVANAQFKAEPRDGRLLVTGLVQLQVGDSASKELAVQAEFSTRDGSVVMTRLARAAPDRQEP